MTSPVPPLVRSFVAALEARGYALWPSCDLEDDGAHAWIIELAPELPGGQVWIAQLDGQWRVGIDFGGTLRSALDVREVIHGELKRCHKTLRS